jgi:hypothetical protein
MFIQVFSSDSSDSSDADTPEAEFKERLFRRRNSFDNPDWSDSNTSTPIRREILVDPADIHDSYPYPSTFRPNIDFSVLLAFDTTPPPPPEPELSAKAMKKAAKAATKAAKLREGIARDEEVVEVPHPKKGHGFGMKSSAEKFREKAIMLKDLETTGKTTIKPDPVVMEFEAELEMLRSSRREMRQLVEARKLVQKHEGKEVKKEVKDLDQVNVGGVEKKRKMSVTQEANRAAPRRGQPKRQYVFQKGKPINPRKEMMRGGEDADEFDGWTF